MAARNDGIKRDVERITRRLIADRRHLHKHPELSGHEKNTAGFVAARLKKLGIAHRTGVGGHGVVGLIKGAAAGKCIALRADMDALPIAEESGVPFASQNKGVMHACGHDAHTAILLSAAEILQKRRQELNGSVKLIFQPSEEKHPGGALPMIQDGAMEHPKVDCIMALHVTPAWKAGIIGVIDGPVMAQADELYITIKGRGGHGSGPHSSIDPIVTAAQAVTALQTVVSRRVNPLKRAVLSICAINGGNTHNIIPDTVQLIGTVRTFEPQVLATVKKEIKRILKGITASAGASYDLDYRDGYPCVINDKTVNDRIRKATTELWGKKQLFELPYPSTGGEDFTYYLQHAPGAFFRLGTGSATSAASLLHNRGFSIDEKALPYGLGVLVRTVVSYLE